MKWIPVIGVVLALLFLYSSYPGFVTWVLIFILVGLLLNRWGILQTYFN